MRGRGSGEALPRAGGEGVDDARDRSERAAGGRSGLGTARDADAREATGAPLRDPRDLAAVPADAEVPARRAGLGERYDRALDARDNPCGRAVALCADLGGAAGADDRSIAPGVV